MVNASVIPRARSSCTSLALASALMPTSTSHRGRTWRAVAFTLACALEGAAHAQPAPEAPAPAPPPAPTAPAQSALGPKPGDARGLEDGPSIEGEDVALFLPRAILYIPSRIVGMVSLPLREGLRFVQRHHVVERVVDFFYNDARTAAIVPVLSASTFFGAQAGIRAFHDDLGGHGEQGAIKASLGLNGNQVYSMSFRANHTAGTRLFIESIASYEVQPKLRFYGLGNSDTPAGPGISDPRTATAETFYGVRRFRHISAIGATLGPAATEVRVAGRGRLKRYDFQDPGSLDQDQRSLEGTFDTAALPGYRDGSTVLETELYASIDTRNRNGATSRGFYAEVFAGGALPLADFEYFHVGAEATGYIDLFHDDRVLVLRGAYEGMEGASEEIPFIELPTLGGPNRLRGYPLGRFRDEHSLVMTLEYHYPIHQYLAGAFFADLGEVSKGFTDLFTDPHPHVGGGGELIIRSRNSVLFTIGVAGGGGVQVYATTDPLRAFADRDQEL